MALGLIKFSNRAMQLKAVIIALFVVIAPANMALSQSTIAANTISVNGNQRIASSTILEIAGLEKGGSYSLAQFNAAKQALIKSGFFETVDLKVNGNTVRISVVERATISRIAFEGNKRLKDEDLAQIVTIRTRQTYNSADVENDARAIAAAYSAGGRLGAVVTPRIIKRADNRLDVVFEIVEGRISDVERVAFTGNRTFNDRRLRAVIDTKQAGLARQIVARDTFISERVAGDRTRLEDFYRNRGFVDMRVVSVNQELTRDGSSVLLTFNIEEGPRYAFSDVTLTSNVDRIDASKYERLPKIKAGRPADPRKVQNMVQELDAALAKDGEPTIVARVELERDDAERQLDLNVTLEENETVVIERIDIEGNATTLDRVIRREFALAEGDVLNLREIRLADERLRALGFFSRVDISTQQGSTPNSVVVKVLVEEQPTGSLTLGGTFDSADGFTVVIGVSERNFLGRGQYFAFDFSNSPDSENYSLSFTEPSFLDRDVSVGFDISYATQDKAAFSFSEETARFNPRVEFNLNENARLRVGYKIESQTVTLDDVDADDVADVADISDIIERDAGDRLANSVSLSYTLDKRNSVIAPTAGYRFTAGQELAYSGGAGSFAKSNAKVQAFTAINNDAIVLRGELEAGALFELDGYARVTDRYFLGGNSLRGFKSAGIGPREDGGAGGGDGQAVGGNYFAVARAEARFPIGLPEEYGIKGGLFLEAGSVWGLSDIPAGSNIDDSFFVNSAVGFSIFWKTQIGPLRFNWSRPISQRAGDIPENFRFTVDTSF